MPVLNINNFFLFESFAAVLKKNNSTMRFTWEEKNIFTIHLHKKLQILQKIITDKGNVTDEH